MALLSYIFKFFLVVIVIAGVAYIFLPKGEHLEIRRKIILGLFSYIIIMVVITLLMLGYERQYGAPDQFAEMIILVAGAIGATILSSIFGVFVIKKID